MGSPRPRRPADRLARDLAVADPRYAVDDSHALADPGGDGDYIGVSELSSAAGSGAVVDDERVTGRLKFRQAWLARHGLVARYCRVIHVLGESMEPTLVDGCVILVNRAGRQRRVGRVYVVRTEDGLVVKRAGKDPAGAWQLVSDNPDKRTWPSRPWPPDAEIVARSRGPRGHSYEECLMNPIVSETDSAVEEPTATTKATPVRARRAPKNDTPRRKQATKNGGSPTPSRRRVRVAEGIYKDRHGLAATVKVNGVQREIRFPPGTPLKTIRARRDALRASLRTLPAGARHTVAHDAGRYLQQVSGELVSIADRQYHLGLWTARFGHLRTLALPQHTAALNHQLRQWRETRSASACNHRRDALTNLVKVLYGRRAAAELVDLVRFTRPPPRPRWLDRTHIADVLAQLTPRLHDRSTLTADALDGHAAVADGTLAAGRRPPRRADAVRRRAARQGGTTGGNPARRRRAGRGPRVRRDRRLRALVVREREQGAPRGGPARGTPRVHRVSDPACVRDGASADGIGRGGHPGSVRAYGSRDDDDLRPARSC